MKTSPGSASPGKSRCGGNPQHLADYREAVENLVGPGLVYPSFESRAEIARLVAQREADGAMAARPRRRAALSRRGKVACAPSERAQLLESGAPYALRLDMAAARALRRRSRLDRARRRSRRRDRRGRGPAGGLGRRHSGAPGDADQLSPLGRDRRRPARRDRGGARPGSVLVDQRASAAAGAAWPARSRPTGTTVWFSTAPGESSRNRPRPPACANSAPVERRRPTSAAWSACRNCRGCRWQLRVGKLRFGVTPAARPCHGGPARVGGIMASKSRSQRTTRPPKRRPTKKRAADVAVRQGAQPARGRQATTSSASSRRRWPPSRTRSARR